jgi:flavin-dependent dehydrogenase
VDPGHIHTDVLIAGGGPAGGAAAIACAERGLRVVLAERDPFQRERPGEALHPGVEPLLQQLGLGVRFHDVVGARHAGIWIDWAGVARFEPFGADAAGPWRGFQVNRIAFDGLLLARARELGVEVRQPCGVLGLAREADESWRVNTEAGPVSCRLIVDATGSGRWLSRRLRLGTRTWSPPLVVRFGYAQGRCPARDEAPLLHGDETGWSWTACVRPGVYQWVRLDLASRTDVAPPEALQGLAPLGPPRGADVTWRLSDAAAGPGWFIAGDAAAMLDPTSSHGVLKALMSGIMTAHLAVGVLKQSAPGDAAAAAYRQWLEGWFATDIAKLKDFYAQVGASGFGVEQRAVPSRRPARHARKRAQG